MKTTLSALLVLALPAAALAQPFEASLSAGLGSISARAHSLNADRAARLSFERKLQDEVRKAIRKVAPATVKLEVSADMSITIDSSKGVPGALLGLPGDLPPLPVLPGEPVPPPMILKHSIAGTGSGFIVGKDEEGRPLIVTNAHVVDLVGREGKAAIKLGGGKTIEGDVVSATVTVVYADGSRQSASVLGFNHGVDLGLVRANAPCPSCALAKLGDSDKLQMGDFVVALGAPFGIQNTATLGIVSNPKRQGPPGMIDDYIQTDAAINPGNSGGPMTNTRGEVVGVDSMMLAPQGNQVGVNFAIPSHYVAEMLARYRATGEVNFARAGISIDESPSGELTISDVTQNARQAGLAAGDVIVSVDGRVFRSARELIFHIADMVPGSKAVFVVSRNAVLVTVSVPTVAID